MTALVAALPSGLTAAEVDQRRERDGRNVVPAPRRTPAWRLLVAQLTHFFAGMLWVAALLALLAGMATLAVAIAVIVLLNGVFAFAQEHKADRAAAQLDSMMPARVRVRRGGETLTVDVVDLVRDDVLSSRPGTSWAAPGRPARAGSSALPPWFVMPVFDGAHKAWRSRGARSALTSPVPSPAPVPRRPSPL